MTLMYEHPVGTPGNVGSCIVSAKHAMLEQLYISSDNFSCIYKQRYRVCLFITN